MNYSESSTENYWEQEEPIPKKKKVSFNDILSNMNLIVNKQGVLQQMVPNRTHVSSIQQATTVQEPPLIEQSIEPQLKHSYIYNKYFKDYRDSEQPEWQPRVPKTMEEYRQMLADDRKKAYEQKMRIEQIKSTKMLFTTSNTLNPQLRNMRATQNTLNTMKFT